jgi:chromosome segregation ATPase
MLLTDLLEAREKGLTYTEKRHKTTRALERVILELNSSDAASATKLARRYERLDKTARLLKEQRDAMNTHIKAVADRLFDAEDELVTRVMQTAKYTMTISAITKAKDRPATTSVNFERAFSELAALVPDLQEAAEKILAKYTEITPATADTAAKLTVKSRTDESLAALARSAITKLMDWVRSWGISYDKKLKTIMEKYPTKMST